MSIAETTRIEELLGDEAQSLLSHSCETIPSSDLHLPGPDFVDRGFLQTDRSPQLLRNRESRYGPGRLAGWGYVPIVPVDQGIEGSGVTSFAPNPRYFEPEG